MKKFLKVVPVVGLSILTMFSAVAKAASGPVTEKHADNLMKCIKAQGINVDGVAVPSLNERPVVSVARDEDAIKVGNPSYAYNLSWAYDMERQSVAKGVYVGGIIITPTR